MLLTAILLVLVGALSAVYMWFQRNHSYWKRKGLPYVEPTPIIGNTLSVFKQTNSFGMYVSEVYNDPRMENEAVVGVYVINKPGLVIREPELIKTVLIKDFNRFSNRYGRADPHSDPMSTYNILFARNSQWREIRTKLTPMFSSGKLKAMYPLIQEVSNFEVVYVQSWVQGKRETLFELNSCTRKLDYLLTLLNIIS